MFKESNNAEPIQKHMSIDCEGLIVQFTGNAKMCKNCSKIKHNCGKTLNETFTEETPISKFKRESYMTNDEKNKKLQHVKKSLRLARQQTEYYKQKCLQIEMEMYELSQEDHDDMNTIYQTIDKDKIDRLSDDQRIFWETQAKVLNSESSHGHRWHPT